MKDGLGVLSLMKPYKLVLDDDLLPSPLLVKKMLSLDQTIVGVYGKANVPKASRYEMLTDHWCVNAKVDFLVGSIVMVKQEAVNYKRRFNEISKS